jgi:MFS transporter, DHA2 family, multidrug resistance protein
LMNLARNIGGSVGISVVTTMLARRGQFHEAQLSTHLSASNPNFQKTLAGITSMLEGRGFSASDAARKAYAMLQATVLRQANMLAYVDCFWLLGVAILAMIPLVFLMKKTKPGASMAVH